MLYTYSVKYVLLVLFGVPEIEITIKVNMCSRCHHLWQRRRDAELAKTCPACNSPYWDSVRVKKGKEKEKEKGKRFPPLKFHGADVLEYKEVETPKRKSI
jgi:hypothetical protein